MLHGNSVSAAYEASFCHRKKLRREASCTPCAPVSARDPACLICNGMQPPAGFRRSWQRQSNVEQSAEMTCTARVLSVRGTARVNGAQRPLRSLPAAARVGGMPAENRVRWMRRRHDRCMPEISGARLPKPGPRWRRWSLYGDYSVRVSFAALA